MNQVGALSTMTDKDTELAAIINDEKMTDTEMAMYLIRFLGYARQSTDPQMRKNFMNLIGELAGLALKKMTNPYAKKFLIDALKKSRRSPFENP